MASDWIKLHRAITNSPIFENDALFRLWMYCLLRANWKPRKWLIPGTLQEIAVPRGAFVTGRQSLFEAMYPRTNSDGNLIHREYVPAPITLWRWLKSLESMGCLKIKTVNNRCSVVTVCNYNTYQDMKPGDDQVVNNQRSGSDQVVITIEEDQEFKNENKETPSPRQNSDFESQSLTMLNGPSEAFREFMAVYPLPAYPNLAWKAWQSEVAEMTMQGMTDAQAESTLIDAAKAYAESPAGGPPADPGNDFRPSPAKFISGGKYLEPPSLWQSPNARSQARGRGGGRSRPNDARMKELDDYLNTEGPK